MADLHHQHHKAAVFAAARLNRQLLLQDVATDLDLGDKESVKNPRNHNVLAEEDHQALGLLQDTIQVHKEMEDLKVRAKGDHLQVHDEADEDADAPQAHRMDQYLLVDRHKDVNLPRRALVPHEVVRPEKIGRSNPHQMAEMEIQLRSLRQIPEMDVQKTAKTETEMETGERVVITVEKHLQVQEEAIVPMAQQVPAESQAHASDQARTEEGIVREAQIMESAPEVQKRIEGGRKAQRAEIDPRLPKLEVLQKRKEERIQIGRTRLQKK